MAVLFGTKPGTGAGYIVKFDDTGVTPAMIQLPQLANSDLGEAWKSTVILTSAGLSQQANVQYMHTLKNHIYVYSFGQRMGALELSGLTMWNTCNTTTMPGLWAIMSFYAGYNVGLQMTPVTVVLGTAGNVVINGFLDNITTTFNDSSIGLLGFRMHFSTLPTLWLNT